MKVIRILFLLSLFGCGYFYNSFVSNATKELAPIVKEFEKEIGVSTKGVRIYFANLEKRIAGRCFYGFKVIQIDKAYYSNLTYIERKALIYHELGHCVCNIMKHVEDKRLCGSSIMADSMQNKICYQAYWNTLVKDLSKRCR